MIRRASDPDQPATGKRKKRSDPDPLVEETAQAEVGDARVELDDRADSESDKALAAEDVPSPGLEAVGLDDVDDVDRPPSDWGGAQEEEEPKNLSPATESKKLVEPVEIRQALEAVLFSVSEPLGIRALAELLEVGVHEIRSAVDELCYEYVDQNRAFRIEEIAGGVQVMTKSEFGPWIRRLRQRERAGRLSAAALETLSVVAYKQPITRADLEAIRGVDCSQIVRTLIDRGLLKVAGRDEGIGKPLLYGTTKHFLESFGLESIRDLPQPEDLAARAKVSDTEETE